MLFCLFSPYGCSTTKCGIDPSKTFSPCDPSVGQRYCRTERTDVYRANPDAGEYVI